MHFLYPFFLTAFLVLLVPIIIHLFRFRRFKTVLFSNVRFLRDAETVRKNQSRLKHLLVLASRILALACLVLAFAIPGCGPTVQKSGKAAVAIFIDNSFSMDQNGTEGILLEKAKQKAREIVKSLGSDAEFNVFTCEPDPTGVLFTGQSEAIQKIDEIVASPYSPSAGRIYRQFADRLANSHSNNRVGYMISDMQGTFLRELPEKKSSFNFALHFIKPGSNHQPNLGIDSAWLVNPFSMAGQSSVLNVRVGNYTPDSVGELSVRLMVDGSMRGMSTINISAFQHATCAIAFKMPVPGFAKAWLELDDPANPFDNKLFLSLEPQGNLPVAVEGNNLYLQRALATNEFFKISAEPGKAAAWYIQTSGQISENQMAAMEEKLQSGGRVVVFPSINAGFQSFSNFESRFGLPKFRALKSGKIRVDPKSLGHVFFNQVFQSIPRNMEMPVIFKYFSTEGNSGSGDAVIALENGDPLMLRMRVGKGYLYFFTTAFETAAGNFIQSSLFLPVVVNCAVNSEQTGTLYGHVASGSGYILKKGFNPGENNLVLKSDRMEFTPEVKHTASGLECYIGPWLREAGIYTLTDRNQPDKKEMIALNYPRFESDPRAASAELIENFIEKTGADELSEKAGFSATQINADSRLWRLFIWLAAAFFAVEVLLLVFWDPVVKKISAETKQVSI